MGGDTKNILRRERTYRMNTGCLILYVFLHPAFTLLAPVLIRRPTYHITIKSLRETKKAFLFTFLSKQKVIPLH